METKKVLIGYALTMLFTWWGLTSGDVAAERANGVAAERDKGQVAVENFVVDSLGTSTFATDVYHVHCSTGATHLFADVDDQGPGAGVLISVCVHDAGGNPALCTTAPDTATSPGIEVSGGPVTTL